MLQGAQMKAATPLLHEMTLVMSSVTLFTSKKLV